MINKQVGNDTASVGYYKTTLQNGVVAELSASRHAGIINYSFPSGKKYVLVDVSHVSCMTASQPLDMVAYLTYDLCSIFPGRLETPAHSFTLPVKSKSIKPKAHIKGTGLMLAGGTMVNHPPSCCFSLVTFERS